MSEIHSSSLNQSTQSDDQIKKDLIKYLELIQRVNPTVNCSRIQIQS
jgi:hypothetical protein